VLHERGRPEKAADSFGIVLTPSCDLVPGQAGEVSHALLAACAPFDEFKIAAGLDKGTSAEKQRKRLPAALNRDQMGGFAPVPGLPGMFPTMCVNFRNLRLVPAAEIALAGENLPFSRRASLDSPFREKLMWGYVQIAGRPATPTLDPTNLLNEVAPLPPPASSVRK